MISQPHSDNSQDSQVHFVTFHPSFCYEEFVEGITVELETEGTLAEGLRYQLKPGLFKNLCKKALAGALGLPKEQVDEMTWRQVYETFDGLDQTDFEHAPKFILVIDEINRGDMAKIFGELITLLEEDKRLGESNELVVTLPASRDLFGVPPNLYIIGTMNTADRSIALLDVALRRRFGFVEMNPDFDTLDIIHIQANEKEHRENGVYELLQKSRDALQKINDRILEDKAIGRDKQIGHSFLFKVHTVDDLVCVWKYEILPLIEEYCYSEYKKINRLLFNQDTDTQWISEKDGIRDLHNVEEMLDAVIGNG